VGNRVYRIKSKSNDEYLVAVEYQKINKGRRIFGYCPIYSDKPEYFDSIELNWLINRIVTSNLGHHLDDVEIEAFEIPEPAPYIPVKSGLKIQTLKKRVEAKIIVRRLQNAI
jgi:hypothetical protein